MAAVCSDEERAFLDAIAAGKPVTEELTKLQIAKLDPALEAELLAAKAQLVTAQDRYDAAWNALHAAGVQGPAAVAFVGGK